jgi:hypothetical protein
MSDEQAVVKRSTTEVVPSYLDSIDLSGPTGLEAIGAKDIKMPRLSVAQATESHAQLMNEDSPNYIPGLKIGYFFDTVNKIVFGKGPLTITPLVAKNHRRYFTPRSEGSKTLCISDNGKDGGRLSTLCATCSHSKFGWDNANKKATKPACTEFWTYLILIHSDEDHFYPISFSLKSKMLDSAKELNTFMRGRRIKGHVAPAFTGIYTVETFYDTSSAAGKFYNVKFRNADWVPERLLANVKMMFDEFGPRISEATQAAEKEAAIEAEVVHDDDEVPF